MTDDRGQQGGDSWQDAQPAARSLLEV